MNSSAPPRAASVERSTKETKVRVDLELDGSGRAEVSTGVGFFDHMLDLLARHARFNLSVNAEGDLETGAHHTTEDVGIVLGQALDRALGDRRGITRYGDAMVPMDEALGACAIDVSGRPYCSFEADLPPTSIAASSSRRCGHSCCRSSTAIRPRPCSVRRAGAKCASISSAGCS